MQCYASPRYIPIPRKHAVFAGEHCQTRQGPKWRISVGIIGPFDFQIMDSPRQRRRGVLTDRLSKEHLSCLRLKIRGFQRNASENSCSRSGLSFDLQAAVYDLKSLSHADQSETLPRETFVFIETFPVIRHR